LPINLILLVLAAIRRVVEARAIDKDADEEEEEEEEDEDEEKEAESFVLSLVSAGSGVFSCLLPSRPFSLRSLRNRDNPFTFFNRMEDDGCRGVMT
jgi:hypothetical protein